MRSRRARDARVMSEWHARVTTRRCGAVRCGAGGSAVDGRRSTVAAAARSVDGGAAAGRWRRRLVVCSSFFNRIKKRRDKRRPRGLVLNFLEWPNGTINGPQSSRYPTIPYRPLVTHGRTARAGIPRFGVVPPKKLTTPPKKIALAREKQKNTPKAQKHPQKTQKHPQKAQKHPQKAKKTPKKIFRAYARKKNPLFQKLIDFAGTPRPPATPGIPALRTAGGTHTKFSKLLEAARGVTRHHEDTRKSVMSKQNQKKNRPTAPLFLNLGVFVGIIRGKKEF